MISLKQQIEKWRDKNPFDFTPCYYTLHKTIEKVLGLLDGYVCKSKRELKDKVKELKKESLDHCLDNPMGSISPRWVSANAVKDFIEKELLEDSKKKE